MLIARVVGTLVSTIKHPAYHGFKLLVVQPLHLPGDQPDADFVAIDHAQAGVGDVALVMREGNGARQVTGIPDAPIISVVVGIVDSVELAEST